MVDLERRRRPRSIEKIAKNAEALKENDEKVSSFPRSELIFPNSLKI